MTTQSELMRQIADAMERNPEGWWKDFEYTDRYGGFYPCYVESDVFDTLASGFEVRPKPRTYRLVIEDMPEPLLPGQVTRGSFYWLVDQYRDEVREVEFVGDFIDIRRLKVGLCYPDESTAREALEKLTRAMGGGE